MSFVLAGVLSVVGIAGEEPLRDKTFVAWVSNVDLDQRGGSVITLEDRKGHFDALVYGEIAPRRWMAGSETFARTQMDQSKWTEEAAPNDRKIQLAIVYEGRQITLYRDGERYARYELKAEASPVGFDSHSVLVAGMRHLDQGDAARFRGNIDDMRIYASALTAEELAALKPNEASPRAPWAWWSFEGSLADQTGRFKSAALQGIAEVRDGYLKLYGGSMMAAQSQAELEAIVPPVPDPELTRDIERSRALRHKMLADRDRPTYHFVIPEDFGMPFDPNGAIFWKGRYHLFYIYQDQGVHKFGHVSSLDLVHWRHHPPALFPTPDSPEKGIFSGNCFVNKRGEATMVYHGVGAGNCMATASDDELDHWKKLPTNPYLPHAPEGAPYRSWDPFGWLDGDTYYTISGGERAAVFKAGELTDKWSYVGDFLHHTVPGVELREDISCADFFKLGGKDVLICISHRLGARYYVGDWKDEQFHPLVHERMSWADNLYFAPETLVDDAGRRVLWAWIFDQRSPAKRQASGWSGEMALPREIWLGDDNRLRMRPVEELKRLRFDEKSFGAFSLAADSERVLNGAEGDACELEIDITPKGAKEFGVRVCRTPDGGEGVDILVDTVNRKLVLGNEAAPFEVQDGKVKLRVFVDRSVIEVFGDDRQAVVRRHYSPRADALGVSLVAKGGAADFGQVVRWRMFPANSH